MARFFERTELVLGAKWREEEKDNVQFLPLIQYRQFMS